MAAPTEHAPGFTEGAQRSRHRAVGARCHDPARVCIVKLERLRVDVHWRDAAVLAGGARCRLMQHIVTDVDCNELEPARNVRDVQPGLHTNHETAPRRPANEGGLEPATAEIGPLEHLCI